MDALAARRAARSRTVKPCGSGSPMLESSFRNHFRRRWWLTSPAHQEEHGAAVKPLRRECRSDFGVPVLACVRVFVLHARQWVRRAPGIPCALCLERANELQDSDAKSRRGNAVCCLKFKIRRRRESGSPSPRTRREVKSKTGSAADDSSFSTAVIATPARATRPAHRTPGGRWSGPRRANARAYETPAPRECGSPRSRPGAASP